MKIIWRDWSIRATIFLISSLSVIFISIYSIFTYDEDYIYIVIAILFSIFFIVNIIRTKLTYITNKGIRIGNAPDDNYEHFILNKKSNFILWSEIKSITIARKVVRRPLWAELMPYLIIRTKSNKIYESFLGNPKGFLNIIKKSGKDNLLAKNSYYGVVPQNKRR